MTQNMIGGGLVGVIGLLLVLNPRGVWRMTERWKMMNAAEASPAFVGVTRVVGGALAVVGALVAFGVLQ